MQVFVHVCYSRADCSDAITWHSSAPLPSKKSHPVYLMQTATVHSSSTCTGLCSFFISCLSWKNCQTPISFLDLYCKQVLEKLRGSFSLIDSFLCHLFSHDEWFLLLKITSVPVSDNCITHLMRERVELMEEGCLHLPHYFYFPFSYFSSLNVLMI